MGAPIEPVILTRHVFLCVCSLCSSSFKGTNSNVLKGVTYGAVDFLAKPVRSEDLQFLWQHALSKLVCEEKQKHEVKSQKSKKKPRMIWTPELHQRFVNAVNSLGVDKAVPKKIRMT